MIADLILGPIVGAIGGFASQWVAYKSKGLDIEDRKHQRAFDAKMAELNHKQALEMTRAEAEGAQRKIVLEGEVQANVRDLDNLSTAMATMPTWSGIKQEDGTALRWFKTVIEALQTLVRVVVTLFLTYKLAVLSGYVQDLIIAVDPGSLDPQIAKDAAELVLRGFVEMTLIAVGFWFGSRGAVLKPQHHTQDRKSK